MSERTLSIEALERQRGLWLQLAAALERAQGALLHGEVAAFEEYTREQGECCQELVAWSELDQSRGEGHAPIAAASLFDDIARAQKRVRHLNCVHAALLRRASRSLAILRNLMRQRGTIYAPSASWQQCASTWFPRE